MEPVIAAAVGLISGIGALTTWATVKVWPILRKLAHFVDDVSGHRARPGVPARPGLMERIGSVEKDLMIVKAEVKNSHHTNLRDDMDRLQARLDEHITTVDPLIRDLHEQHATKKRGLPHVPDRTPPRPE